MHEGSLLLPWGPKPVNDAGAPEAPQMANLTIVFSTQPLGANCHSMGPPMQRATVYPYSYQF